MSPTNTTENGSYNPTATPHAGRIYIITGAAGDIGQSCAEILLKEGASVGLFDLTEEGLQRATQKLPHPENTFAVAVNVTDFEAVEAGVKRVVEHFGGLDGLIAGAGVVARNPQPASELDVNDWKWVMDINVNGVMACTRAVVKHLEHGSSIVNLASIAGLRGQDRGSAYSASKAAVIGISRVTARDYGPKGIRCNAVCPGPVESSMITAVMERNSVSRESIAQRTCLKRLALPSEIAHMASFLLSPLASYCTDYFVVDGGFLT